MKTKVRRNASQFLVLLMLALSVVVVATSIAPSSAQARVRPENSTPLMGDPTDTEDGPQTTVAKAASISRTPTVLANGDGSNSRMRSWYSQLRYVLALVAAQLQIVRRI